MDRDTAFRRLNEYCHMSYVQIGARRLERPILKTYVLETARLNQDSASEFGPLGRLVYLDDGLAEISDDKGPIAYLENLRRFQILYTLLPTTDIEPDLTRLVRASYLLDTLWLAGEVFGVLFNNLSRSSNPWRFVRAVMGHTPIFEDYRDRVSGLEPGMETGVEGGPFGEELEESPVSRLQASNRLERIRPLVDLLRTETKEFRNISMLRVPALSAAGGHEFYFNGKVTNRSSDFFDHRSVVATIVRMYERMTERVEDRVWLGVTQEGNGEHLLGGCPVVLRFEDKLNLSTFGRFLDVTFEKGQGPFRLWGNLLDRGRNCYHFYGLDLHLMNEIFLELTPSRFLAFLPDGTCGNTVHRLVTNIQRFLAPSVTVFVGDERYSDIAEEAFSGFEPQEPVGTS